MKKLIYFAILIFAVACGSKTQHISPRVDDSLAQYRDTLIGRFNGIDIDTLICEPIDSLSPMTDEWFGGKHFQWRVYTTNGTVKDLIIGNTERIDFIKEGDLDGNDTEEWGYVSQYPTSQWENYHSFTAINKEWKPLIDPTPIWESHIDITGATEGTITYDDIAKPSHKKGYGYVDIKFSDIRNNGEDFLLIDTVFQVTSYK